MIAAVQPLLWAEGRRTRYALILHDPPVAEAIAAKGSHAALADAETRVAAAQRTLEATLDDRRIAITGSARNVLNAVFVVADEGQLDSLRALPGVARVEEMQPLKRLAVRALDLVRIQEAWRNTGGEANAGAGVRIAVLDTGIDQNHPAFSGSRLSVPAGYPRCAEPDCRFTNNKVIAARSYVEMLVLGDNPVDSRPDDLSARDRVGHGTAVAMLAAGHRHASPLGSMAGVAPGAQLGNYKIFGSPGVNDVTFDDVVIRALDDAVRDGMHIAVLSLGRPAIWAPQDRGNACDRPNDRPCDPWADAVDQATRAGMTVVVAAGNDGDVGLFAPSYNSIHTPGSVPTALTVGSSTNVQRYFSQVRAAGRDPLPALFGDGPRLSNPVQGPGRDVAAMTGEDARACTPLSNASLAGAIGIVQQGGCSFATKVNHAQRAGALGVIVQRPEGSNAIFKMTNLKETGIPAVMVGSNSGRALQDLLRAAPGSLVTLDPALITSGFDEDDVAFFSSYGPGIGGGAIKPEVVAPGHAVYMATQSFDPYGDMYSPDGFIAAQGTSFAAPVAAGAAALFKQRFSDATAAQVKSAVVNTALAEIGDYDRQDRRVQASVLAVGAGKVNAGAVTTTNVTVEPAVLSFGYLTATLPAIGVRVNNHTANTINLTVAIQPRGPAPSATVAVDVTNFQLAGRSSRQLSFQLRGTRPAAGIYEGDVVITGGAVRLRVPYLYLVGDGVPDNLIPLRGFDFVSQVETRMRIAFKAIDRFGVPVRDISVRYRATLGDGSIAAAFPRTDMLGISDATVVIGPRVGDQEFSAEAGNLTVFFQGAGRLKPAVRTDGVVNAASGTVGRGVSPGSYVSIFGRNLSDSTRIASTPWLPPAVAGVSVSFDVPERRISVPGRVHFVSDGQVNVQVPWELQGLNSAIMKVSIGNAQSDLYTVPLNDHSPAMFEFTDPGSGRLLAATLDENFRIVTTGNAIPQGRVAQIFANGLGPVENRPGTGEPTSSETLAPCRVLPIVSVGGRPAEVLYCGLAPGNVGLYQLNVRVPTGIASGVQPVVVTSNGIDSKTSNLPVQ